MLASAAKVDGPLDPVPRWQLRMRELLEAEPGLVREMVRLAGDPARLGMVRSMMAGLMQHFCG